MKTRIILAAAAAGVLLAGLGWHEWGGAGKEKSAAPPPPAVPVTVGKAARQDVRVYLDGIGTVQALNVVAIRSQVTGNIVALPAKEGQEVRKGDIVAEIDPRPYQAALDQATAQRAGDLAQLQSSKLNLQRYRDLARHSDAPVQQVDDQQATVNKQAASLAADDAAIQTAQINLGYCVIHAPIDGKVGFYQTDVGNLVQAAAGTSIITITQDKPISVVFTLPESQLQKVVDAAGRGAVPVLVDNGQSTDAISEGTLATPDNTIDTSTGTIPLKATFANTDSHLWPGQFIGARIQVDLLKDAVTIPTLAIEHGPQNLFVYTLQPDSTVAEVPVETGYADGGRTVVTKGLSGTETVAVSGQSRLSQGTKVKVPDGAAGGAASAAHAQASEPAR